MDNNDNNDNKTITLSPAQTRVVAQALDLYTRLGIGQFEIMGEVICDLHKKKTGEIGTDWWDLKKEVFGPLKERFGFPVNGSHGIASPKVSEETKIAHDIWSALHRASFPKYTSLICSKEGEPNVKSVPERPQGYRP